MRRVMAMVARIAPSDANVLVLGENGTGKGVVAQQLHDAVGARGAAVGQGQHGRHCRDACSSRRCSATCAAPTPTPRASASAASSWPTAAPCSSTKSATCRRRSSRSCCACWRMASSSGSVPRARRTPTCGWSRPPMPTLPRRWPQAASASDLLYRLNTLEIASAAAARAAEDILPLARAFLARSAQRYGRAGLAAGAVGRARAAGLWRWPGNVRELRHLMERAALLAEHDEVERRGAGLRRSRCATGGGPRRHDPGAGRGATWCSARWNAMTATCSTPPMRWASPVSRCTGDWKSTALRDAGRRDRWHA